MNEIILETRGLTKVYKQTAALNHIDIKIKRGKIYNVINFSKKKKS